MNSAKKPLSSCCEKPAKVNMLARALEGEQAYFCSHCGASCDLTERRTAFKGSTLSNVRKPSGERSLFVERWAACKGRSEVSGVLLLPPDDPRFHFQGCHLLPKGSYQGDRLLAENVVMTTIEEHTEEWPLVKEKTDAELKAMGMSKWVPVVTRFRALRLKYNQRLNAELSGKHAT